MGRGSKNYATYQTTPSTTGKGTFYFTDCGHQMYSVKGPEAYHGCICPGCRYKNIDTVLYIRGSEEANRIMEEREEYLKLTHSCVIKFKPKSTIKVN